MRVELVQEVENDVSIDRRGDDYNMLLVLCPMTAVRSSLLLSLYPRVSQLLELSSRNTPIYGHMVTKSDDFIIATLCLTTKRYGDTIQ